MNDSKKMAIIIAVVFFLAGTMLNIDYAMWNEETYKDYQESEPYICWSLHSDTNDCPEEMRTQIEYNDWKFYNGKSYWKDLAKRLNVLEVSASETNTTESTHLEHSKRVKIESNTSCMDCWYYPDEDRFVWTYNGYCGCGDSNCEGDPEYNEGCTPEESKVPIGNYYEGQDMLVETPPEETITWTVVGDNCTPEELEEIRRDLGTINEYHTEINWGGNGSGYIGDTPGQEFKWEIDDLPRVTGNYNQNRWDYHTFKLPIYRRI